MLSIQTGKAHSQQDAHWSIRDSKPKVTGEDARWERTEVTDGHGNLKLVVENGSAKQMG